MRPIWKMHWKNGCKMTVERMRKEQNAKRLDPETIRKINTGIGEMAEKMDKAGLLKEDNGLKDWQWEIVLENESKDENQE